MGQDWYVRQGGKVFGPMLPSKLKALAEEGRVRSTSEVANSSGGPWHPISLVKGLLFPAEHPPAISPDELPPAGSGWGSEEEEGEIPHVTTQRFQPRKSAKRPRQQSQASHSLGIAALVLGALAFPICWIPLLGLLGLPLSALGVLLGGLGILLSLFRAGSGIGFPIAGAAVSALAVFVSLGVNAAVGKAINDTGRAIREEQAKADATNQVVVRKRNEPSPPVAAESNNKAGENWANARSAVQQGDIRIRVTKVAVQKVPLKNLGRETVSAEPLLAVYIDIENKSRTKKADYDSWRGEGFSLERDTATLMDNFDNSLKRINFGFASEVIGAVRSSESIYPDKSVSDVLVFETPIEATESLRLELPARNFGGTGTIRLEIPKDMIER